MIKAVLFDFHNTLATCDEWLQREIRTLPGLVLKRLAMLGEVHSVTAEHFEEAERRFRSLRGRVRETGVELSAFEGVHEVLREMGFVASDETIMSAVVKLQEECLAEVRMVPGADIAVRELHSAGFALGIVSSAGYPPFVEIALQKLGLRGRFTIVVTSAGEGIYKSDPEIFRRAVTRLGAKPGESVHIGDHPAYDVKAAKAAGLAAIWFRGETRRTANIHGARWEDVSREAEGADAVVERMEEAPEAVARVMER